MKTKPSFEVVSHLLMLEEPEPTPEALERWQKRYPDYRHSLAEFFEVWAMTNEEPEEELRPDPAEDQTVEKCLSYAMGILQQQGRLIPEDLIETIQPFDQLVLDAIVDMDGIAYSGSITRRLSEVTGKRVLLASTLASLARLESKRLVQWRYADPKTEPENQNRQYFMATMAGERSLAHAKALARAADFSGDFAWKPTK